MNHVYAKACRLAAAIQVTCYFTVQVFNEDYTALL